MKTAARLPALALLALGIVTAGATPAGAAVVLAYCGYIGGDRYEANPSGIAVDGAGSAYVSGMTASSETTFPAAVGPDLTFNGGEDAFVAKVRADGTALVYAGYIGGDRDDGADDVAVDASGNAYVFGSTTSTEATFPEQIGPDLTFGGASGRTGDDFVAKVRADGTRLAYAGYLGGELDDHPGSIAVDGAGRAHVAGSTLSTEASFPVAVGPDLTYNGSIDSFVARVRADGTGLVYAGFIGGDAGESQAGIALDAAGAAYVADSTASTGATFPLTVGPALTYGGGLSDAFVAKVRADGTGLVYAGYVGGDSSDAGYGIDVDAAESACFGGRTSSSEATFPLAAGPDLTYNGGSFDGFVARVRADGTGLVFAGYIGGDAPDAVNAVRVGADGKLSVAGSTSSTGSTFPVIAGPDLTYNGGANDSFVARVRADGTGLDYAGYIGGSDRDVVWDVAMDVAGDTFVVGDTWSPESSFPVRVGPELRFGGDIDMFVARLAVPGCLVPPAVVGQLLAVKGAGAAGDVDMEWIADPAANGYNLWYVLAKEETDLAREANQPPALPVAGCATPAPASGPACTDVGGVTRGSPSIFFYQVRAFCGPLSEGP